MKTNMIFTDLKLNRFLIKTDDSNNSNNSEDFSKMSVEQASANVYRKKNSNNSDANVAKENDDAQNILTGTVITNCIIQTSSLPNRILIQGNDISFFNNTYLANGVIKGDTSRLVFGRSDSPEGTFIMEERTSIHNNLDNVLSWYATPAATGHYNWMFFGRNGDNSDPERNLGAMYFAVNIKSAEPASAGNGVWGVEVDTDGVLPITFGILTGDTRTVAPFFTGGYSTVITAEGGGAVAMGYPVNTTTMNYMWYITDYLKINMGASILPDANGTYDIGSPSMKIGTLYGSVSACPLPTISDALEIVRRIPEPTKVGDRGHYGDRLYFDDLTFPEEVLYTNKKGATDLEHNHLLGFLMKAVVELTKEVDELKKIINK